MQHHVPMGAAASMISLLDFFGRLQVTRSCVLPCSVLLWSKRLNVLDNDFAMEHLCRNSTVVAGRPRLRSWVQKAAGRIAENINTFCALQRSSFAGPLTSREDVRRSLTLLACGTSLHNVQDKSVNHQTLTIESRATVWKDQIAIHSRTESAGDKRFGKMRQRTQQLLN